MSATRYFPIRHPGGRPTPSVFWGEINGPNCGEVCRHRYWWAARLCAWARNLRRGPSLSVRELEERA